MFTLSDGGSTLSEEETSAIIWIFTTVALLTTVVRLYVRILVIKAFRLDDFLALAGQVSGEFFSFILPSYVYLETSALLFC